MTWIFVVFSIKNKLAALWRRRSRLCVLQRALPQGSHLGEGGYMKNGNKWKWEFYNSAVAAPLELGRHRKRYSIQQQGNEVQDLFWLRRETVFRAIHSLCGSRIIQSREKAETEWDWTTLPIQLFMVCDRFHLI